MDSYRIIFSDIDGTLLDSKSRLPDNNLRIITELNQKGIPFVLVSARSPSGVEMIARCFPQKSPIICYSGALILDKDRTVMKSSTIRKEIALSIKKRAAEHYPQVDCSAYSEDQWIVDSLGNPWVRYEAELTRLHPLEGALDVCLQGGAPVHKIMCMGDPAPIDGLYRELSAQYPALNVCKSKDTYLEIMAKEAAKAAAIRTVCEASGIALEEAVAFGDHFNDSDMLSAAGLGIAMGNAPEAVRNAADTVTAGNDEEGVYRSLRHLIDQGRFLIDRKPF